MACCGPVFFLWPIFFFSHQVNMQGWSSQVACCLALDERDAIAVHRLKKLSDTACSQLNAVNTASGQNRYATKAVQTANDTKSL